MPEITHTYELNGLDAAVVFTECTEILKKLKGKEFKEEVVSEAPFSKRIQTIIPSIWGWGGLEMGVAIEQHDNAVSLTLRGYIAQLATSPLTAKMDEFLKILASTLKVKYKFAFEYEKTSSFLPKNITKFTATDKRIISAIGLMFFTYLIASLAIDFLARFSPIVFVIVLITIFAYILLKKHVIDQ